MSDLILVAHSTSKVGQEVVKQLHQMGASYRAATQDMERGKKAFGEDVPLVLLNYKQPETFPAALAGVKRMFLLHPLYGIEDAELMAFLDAAAQSGVERLVFMSALGVNYRPADRLYKIEQQIINSGMIYTILRPNWFMQNFNTQDLGPINKRNQLPLPCDDHRLSLIDIRDIAAVAAHILVHGGHEGQAYSLTGSEAFTYSEVAALLSKIAGRTITHHNEKREDLLNRMKEHGVPEDAVYFLTWLFEDIHRGLTARITPHVEEILGRPPIRFSQYLQDYAHVWQIPAEQD